MMESTDRSDAGTLGDVLDDQVQATNPPDAPASDPKDPELLHASALIFFEAAQFDQAVELASRAIRKDPKPVFLTTLGAALLKLRRHDDALKVLDKAVQIKPDDGGLWWSLGTGLIESQRPDEALLCFQRTLELDPDHADAAYKAGHLLCELGHLDEAFLYLSRSAELNPDHGPAWQVRAVVLKRLNRLDEALAEVRRFVVTKEHNLATMCVWSLFTHLVHRDDLLVPISPRLAIQAEEKACGKTTALDSVRCMVLRPKPVLSTTAAAFFRSRGSGYSRIASFVMGVMRAISCFWLKNVAKVPALLNLMPAWPAA